MLGDGKVCCRGIPNQMLSRSCIISAVADKTPGPLTSGAAARGTSHPTEHQVNVEPLVILAQETVMILIIL